MKKLILFTLLLITCSSCNKNQTSNEFSTIKVNPGKKEPVNLSTIAHHIETIALETTEESLIGQVAQLLMSKHYIFIADFSNGVLQFDRKGRFVRKIGKNGQGPGEFTFIKFITINEPEQLLYMLSESRLMSYTFEGTLVQEQKLPQLSAIYFDQEKLLALSSSFGKKKTPNGRWLNEDYLLSLTKSFEITDSLTIRSTGVDRITGVAHPTKMTYLSQLEDKTSIYYPILYKNPFVLDTLYTLSEHSISPELKLDFGIDNNDDMNLLIMNIFRSRDYVFSKYRFNGKQQFFIHNQVTNESYNMTEGPEDDINNTGIVNLMPLNLEENLFYYSKDGYELEGVIDGVTAETNPYIFIVKLGH